MPDIYDVAQICLNGHLVTHQFNHAPLSRKSFCEKCGEKTITTCPNCSKEICGGGIYYEWVNEDEKEYLSHFPYFCKYCGKPYPWTDRKLEALRSIMKEIKLPKKENELLSSSLIDLVIDSPNTSVAVLQWRKFLYGSGKEFLSMFEQILPGLVSGVIQKALFGG